MVQWRLFFHLEKLVQVKRELLSTGKLPLFFQIKVGDKNIYKMQLSDRDGQLNLNKERIMTYIQLPKNQLVIVGQTKKIPPTAEQERIFAKRQEQYENNSTL